MMVNLQMGALPPLPSPAAGIAPPNILAQLGQAIGNFPAQQQAAEKNKLVIEEAKAKADEAKRKVAAEKFQYLVNAGKGNPGILGTPAYVSAVQSHLKELGLPETAIVDDPVSGQKRVDINQIAPKPSLVEETGKNPLLPKYILGLQPGPARDAVLNGYSDVDPNYRTAPVSVAMDPQQKNYLIGQWNKVIETVGTGTVPLDSVIRTLKSNAQNYADAGIDVNSIFSDPQAIAGIGAKIKAEIDQREALGILSKQKAESMRQLLPLEIGKIKSTIDLQSAREKYLGVQTEELPLKVAGQLDYWKKMSAASTSRAATAQAKLDNDIKQSQVGGLKNFPHMTAAVTEVDRRMAEAQRLWKGLAQTAAMMTDAGKEPPKTITDQVAEAKATYDKLKEQSEQLHVPYDSYLKNGLTQSGLKGVNQVNDTIKPPADLRAGTDEYYQSLSRSERAKYLQRSEVPRSVRDYLKRKYGV